MRFLANENLFEPIIEYLRSLGHDILSIKEAGLSGISDDEVYQLSCRDRRVIITMDKDFSRIFRFPPEKCGGIIIVKIYKWRAEDILKIFRKYFKIIGEVEIKRIRLLSILKVYALKGQRNKITDLLKYFSKPLPDIYLKELRKLWNNWALSEEALIISLRDFKNNHPLTQEERLRVRPKEPELKLISYIGLIN